MFSYVSSDVVCRFRLDGGLFEFAFDHKHQLDSYSAPG